MLIELTVTLDLRITDKITYFQGGITCMYFLPIAISKELDKAGNIVYLLTKLNILVVFCIK